MPRNDPTKTEGQWMWEYCTHLAREHRWTQKRLIEYFRYYLSKAAVIGIWRGVHK